MEQTNKDNRQTNENINYIEFLKEIFKDEKIYKEIDSEMGKVIYMPQSIKKLIQLPEVNRMNRILQTGTNIYDDIKMLGSRMQHSKGTYSLMLEVLVQLWQNDPEFKQRIQKNKQEKYIKAILVKEILHDIGHGPFSHTLETACNLPKGFHEQIGKRLIKENPNINGALNDIELGLPDIIKELEEKDTLGLNRLCEGQFDVDRADFIARDNFFIGNNSKKVVGLVQQLLSNIKMKPAKDPKQGFVPVFDKSQMANIEEFFKIYVGNYEIYKSHHKYQYEQIFKAFAVRLIESSEEYPLKQYLKNIIGKNPEEVNLEEYISYDDIEYMKEITNVVKTTEDDNLRTLGLMSLPTINMVPGIYYAIMINSNKRVSMEEQLSESDEQFIRDMKVMEKLRQEKCQEGNFVQENCLLVDTDDRQSMIYFMDRMQGLFKYNYAESNLQRGVRTWGHNITSYKNKPNEEIYIEAQDGDYYEYSVHPERTMERIKKNKLGMCIIVPEIKMDGCDEETIQRIVKVVNEFNEKEKREQDDSDRG